MYIKNYVFLSLISISHHAIQRSGEYSKWKKKKKKKKKTKIWYLHLHISYQTSPHLNFIASPNSNGGSKIKISFLKQPKTPINNSTQSK